MNSTRRALLVCLMIALTVAGGYALAGIPNIEVVTLLVFTSGYLLGPRAGAVVGGVGMGVHSLFNVMGAAIPPVLLAQVVCYAVVGVAGGVVGPVIGKLPGVVAAVVAGVAGAALVVFYQAVVGIVSFYTFTSESMLWAYLWGGIAFASVQIAWNAAVFLVAVRPMFAVLSRYRVELNARWDG